MSKVILIGMRGVGKTTTGKALAEILEMPFLDLDQEIIRMEGKSVPEIVESEGWEGFRKKEQQALHACLEKDDLVLATGGGILMYFDNAEHLKDQGEIILLTSSPETMAKRIGDSDRPSLTGKSITEELAEVWSEREETYRKYADQSVDTENKTPEEVAREISLRCL